MSVGFSFLFCRDVMPRRDGKMSPHKPAEHVFEDALMSRDCLTAKDDRLKMPL